MVTKSESSTDLVSNQNGPSKIPIMGCVDAKSGGSYESDAVGLKRDMNIRGGIAMVVGVMIGMQH